jgi:hypothetical protein
LGDNGEIHHVGLKELATWMGVTTRRVIQMVEEGIIPKAGRGKYPLKQCMIGYVTHLQQMTEKRGSTSELSEEKLLTARIERKRRELEYAAVEGSLITVEAHEQAIAEALDLVRSNLRNLPGSVGPRLVGLDDARDVVGILAPAVDDAMRSIVAEADRRSQDDTLPDDLPGRRALIEHGVTTLTDLLMVPDLQTVPRIGPRTEKRIQAWMREMTT